MIDLAQGLRPKEVALIERHRPAIGLAYTAGYSSVVICDRLVRAGDERQVAKVLAKTPELASYAAGLFRAGSMVIVIVDDPHIVTVRVDIEPDVAPMPRLPRGTFASRGGQA